jgi:xanthine dehydrogenase YagS FAD-binding subunit
MLRFQWSNARTVADAAAQLRTVPDAMLKAGGIDLLDRMKEGLERPSRIVNLLTVPDLAAIREEKEGLRIGPLVTLAQLDQSAVVRAKWTALADAAGHAATPQIRNVATIGGNLAQRPRCWYFRNEEFHCKKKGGTTCFAHDGENQLHAIFGNATCAAVHPSTPATALVALGARVTLTGSTSERTISVEELFASPERDVMRENILAPDEIITAIHLPPLAAGTRSAYLKQGAKESFDWPIVDVAAVLVLRDGRCTSASVVLGAVAPIPRRAEAVEERLVGKALTRATIEAVALSALDGATPLAHNKYKLPIVKAVVARAIAAAAGVAS